MCISKLVVWFLNQCNDDWEHSYGFSVETLDNPGIRLLVDLKGTDLETKEFTTISENMESADRWLYCQKTADQKFEGATYPTQLNRLIEIFEAWKES